jgi:hypothetical protein
MTEHSTEPASSRYEKDNKVKYIYMNEHASDEELKAMTKDGGVVGADNTLSSFLDIVRDRLAKNEDIKLIIEKKSSEKGYHLIEESNHISEADVQAAVGALDWLIVSLNMSHEDWCDHASWRDDFIEKTETIRAALQSPRVPVIPGLDSIIQDGRTWFGVAGNIDPVAVPMKDFDILMRCARAYAELQKGV